MPYEDPENVESLIEQLKASPTVRDALNVMKNVFPDWWNGQTLDSYSVDYPTLTCNWMGVTTNLKCKPTVIMLVENVELDDNHIFTRSMCELLINAGFSVKRNIDYVACLKCKNAIPSKELHAEMKTNNVVVPNQWSHSCISC
jgi:hypothetical protein